MNARELAVPVLPPSSTRVRRWLSVRAYGWLTSSLFRAASSPGRMRRTFERLGATSRGALLARFPALRFEDHALERTTMESLCPVADPERVILYLHGGGFFMGSPASYRRRTMKIGYRCGAEVFVPDYRLAPEHPFPAALEDALDAWRRVRALRPSSRVVVAGDSAGGGLALSLMRELAARGEPGPEGAVLFSPWADLTQSGASIVSRARRDLWLGGELLDAWARHYVPEGDRADPRISPALGALAGLPPTLVLVGDDEVLLDDARRVVASIGRSGGEARLHLGAGMQHDWPLTLPWLEESERAWRDIERFVRGIAPRSAPGASARGDVED